MGDRRKSETLFVTIESIGDRFVEYGPEATVADMLASLQESAPSATVSVQVERTGQLLSPRALLGESDIRSGDLLRLIEVDRRTFPDELAPGRPTATLQMLSGPRVGQLYCLGEGSSNLGRVSSNDVVLVDPGISRHHAVVLVDETSVTITDNGSTNGVTIDGQRIAGPTPVYTGQWIMLGHSWASITHHAAFHGAGVNTEVGFEPTPRTIHRFYEQTILLPSPPDPSAKRRRTDLLPAVRNQYKQAVEQYLAAVDSADQRLRERNELEVASRQYEAPSVHEVLAGVDGKTRLWERHAVDVDALQVRVGLSRLPSRTTIQIPTGGAAEMRAALAALPERYRMVDRVPAIVDFRRHGSVGLSGSPEAVDGLAFSLIAQLAWFHGPEQLGLAYRPGLRSEAWDWLKWLPHLDFAGSHNGVADSDFVSWVSALLDGAPPTTNGAVDEQRVRPASIVIILDNETSLPTALLVRLVQEGPAIGVYPLLLSGPMPQLGVSVGASISVGAESATIDVGGDEPPVEVPLEVIDQESVVGFARRLTPLRCPNSTAGVKLGVAGELVEPDGVIVGPFRLGMSQPSAPAAMVAPEAPAMPSRPAAARRQRDLKSMPHGDNDGRLVLGTVDVPGKRGPAVFACNLARDGSLCLVGPHGSGRTSALRSVAAAAAMLRVDPGRVPMTYFLDVRGDLEGIGVLPHTVGAARNDIDGFRSVVSDLERLLVDRAAALSHADVASFDEYRRIAPQSSLRRVLVVVDEVDAFVQLMDSLEPGRGGALLERLAVDGGRLGIHLVCSVQSRHDLSPTLIDGLGRWLQLGGEPGADELQPGTALVGKNEVRFATVGGERAPQRALQELAAQLVERGVAPVGG